MPDQSAIDQAEARVAALLEQSLRDQRMADFHRGRDHGDADRFVRRAEESRDNYERAARDLALARSKQ